ncbi:DUF6587 family protein [Cupriavidus sp. RAF12]|uniref:DUF6587 family protein n=1 Tax=Cupriavidus sp. RAF12 TaxID=3233050 RepID=UPI003F8DC2E3
MTLYHAFETLVVPLIVVACAVHVAARYMPRTRERVKARLAASLGGVSATGWRGWLAKRLAPQEAAGCATGCDTNSGCSTCGSNTSSPSAGGNDGPANEHIVRLVRKP